MRFKIIGRENLVETIDCEIEESNITDDMSDTYYQLIYLPDIIYSSSNYTSPYILVEREPFDIVKEDGENHAQSDINKIYGPSNISSLIEEITGHYGDFIDHKIHNELVIVRTTKYMDYSDWIDCPNCSLESDIITETLIIPNEYRAEIELTCENCNYIADNSNNYKKLSDWMECPICSSSSIEYHIDVSHSYINLSCDNCNYSTRTSEIDYGLSKREFVLENIL